MFSGSITFFDLDVILRPTLTIEDGFFKNIYFLEIQFLQGLTNYYSSLYVSWNHSLGE